MVHFSYSAFLNVAAEEELDMFQYFRPQNILFLQFIHALGPSDF
jgi:hypothetical protein